MPKELKRYYVVEHINGRFSIQTRPEGGGELLNVPFNADSREDATRVRDIANQVLADAGL